MRFIPAGAGNTLVISASTEVSADNPTARVEQALREVLEDGHTAMLMAPGDQLDLEEGTATVLRDQKRHAPIGR